jgi:hypothetical protein
MTITLQDLQVLNEKCGGGEGEWRGGVAGNCNLVAFNGEDVVGVALVPYGPRIEFIAALVNFYRSGALQRLAELAARHEHDCPTFREFFNKYALGSKLPPSCLMCGRIVHERAVEHAELPDIYICADCKQLAEDGERYRYLRVRINYGAFGDGDLRLADAALDAAIDSARAPSVKGEKS